MSWQIKSGEGKLNIANFAFVELVFGSLTCAYSLYC